MEMNTSTQNTADMQLVLLHTAICVTGLWGRKLRSTKWKGVTNEI